MELENLEIYLSYEKLKAKDLAYLLNNFSFISDEISEDYQNRFGSDNEQINSLDILTINTGNSVKFTLTEGWIPKVSSDAENDIIISIPQKLGIPVMLGYLLISGANQYQDLRSKQLDNQIKEIELQLKKTELHKAMVGKADNDRQNEDRTLNTQDYLNNKVPEVKIKVLDTLKFIYKNPDLNIVRVNNVEIKGRKQ
ncbi:MAG: hypothetical protein K0R36_862 [Chryseobacterium sp.]|jgi:hypothetical protein|nr:hypothetical protein [Chryseobacterium sp.]